PRQQLHVFPHAGHGRIFSQIPSDAAAIFGNLQQQNYHILYDNANHMLSFAPADCASV
ncbi:hypothetical protein KI387_043239, partial [Taxus chinensis]